MAKLELSEEELSGLVEEVLERLARDPGARHLWQWTERPGCEDEPFGRSRRNHLGALLGLVGAAVLPTQACGDPSCGDDPSTADAGTDAGGACADDPCSVDAGFDAGGDIADASTDAGGPCADDPCSVDAGFDAGTDAGFDAGIDAGFDAGFDAGPCADDPCFCADDPCAGP